MALGIVFIWCLRFTANPHPREKPNSYVTAQILLEVRLNIVSKVQNLFMLCVIIVPMTDCNKWALVQEVQFLISAVFGAKSALIKTN